MPATNVKASDPVLGGQCREGRADQRAVDVECSAQPELPERKSLVTEDQEDHCPVHLGLLHGAVHGSADVRVLVDERLQEADRLRASLARLVQAGLARGKVAAEVGVEERADAVAPLQRLHGAGAEAGTRPGRLALAQPASQPHDEHLGGLDGLRARRGPQAHARAGERRRPLGVLRVLVPAQLPDQLLLGPEGDVHRGVYLRPCGQGDGAGRAPRPASAAALPAQAPEGHGDRKCSQLCKRSSATPSRDRATTCS
mmetsp:Transcript_89999/g.263076  ORF Transcript_89999/g.263076 Transcript_89999/m.263076 type:complete len:256 (-) Transcript_89999:206-973(-)